MRNLSIRKLEEYSGIKSHTIRMWEQRYSIFSPIRSAINRRTYTIDDLKKLLDITLLNKRGIKISHLARLSEKEISEQILLTGNKDEQLTHALHQLFVSMHRMKPETFEMTLDNCFFLWPHVSVMTEVVFTFLKRTKLLWKGNSLTEEHFAVTCLRKKLISGIEKAEAPGTTKKTVLLFLPNPGQLDLGLLYIYYLLKRNGYHVLYMGTGVTLPNLEAVFKLRKPEFVLTYLPSKTKFRIDGLSSCLTEYLPLSIVIVISPQQFNHGNVITTTYEGAMKTLLR